MRFLKRKQLTPEQQKVYHAARAAETARIQKAKQDLELARIKARAVRDAQISSAGRGSRIAGALVTGGRAIGKKLDKIDMEKFEAHVTGVSLEKKKK